MKRLKTLIVIDNLKTGGVASSLYNYLAYVHDKMDCHLLAFDEDSIDKTKIPNDVKILKPQAILHILGKNQRDIQKESKLFALVRIVYAVLSRLISGEFARRFYWPFIHNIGDYDLAIAYAQDDAWRSLSKGCGEFVIKKVNTKFTALLIHCDYKNFGGYNVSQEKQYSNLDAIICVSESCKKSFVQCFPLLENKVITCENFINVVDVQQKSSSAIQYNKCTFNFVSVCRISAVKGLERTINAFISLKSNGILNYTWTIVGDGPLRRKLESMVEKAELENRIRFVGNKENPYPYIKNADAFLLPSFHEAAPMVFGESAVLGVPIVCSDTCSARELVTQRGLGIVFDNNDKSLYDTLYNILKQKVTLKIYEINPSMINAYAEKQFAFFVDCVKKKVL